MQWAEEALLHLASVDLAAHVIAIKLALAGLWKYSSNSAANWSAGSSSLRCPRVGGYLGGGGDHI